SVLIGGAIGNLIDRFIHGAVIDFVDIHYKTWHWPAFNFADMCISCSVIAMIVYNMFAKEQ
ncbi:MAG: signal peptidase II, partial [Alphaproteobacteria bacterium]|nr:signal peptidase II [Alphaproteobacteria bacterium]